MEYAGDVVYILLGKYSLYWSLEKEDCHIYINEGSENMRNIVDIKGLPYTITEERLEKLLLLL